MSTSAEYIEYILDQLRPIGSLSTRRMFGCVGVFHQGLMFALIDNGRLYIKSDPVNRPLFMTQNYLPFTYISRGKTMPLYYHAMPEDIIDEQDDLLTWAKLGIAAALHTAKTAKTKTQK